MGIILCKPANPGEAVQFPALLVPVNGAKFGIPDGQILIGMRLAFIDFAMMRAVHRF